MRFCSGLIFLVFAQLVLQGQDKNQFEFGVSYALNTFGDIPSVVIRNQYSRHLKGRFHAMIEAHVLDGGGDGLGLMYNDEGVPYVFIDKYDSYPFGAKPGPRSVEGIKSLPTKTDRSTFYSIDLDLGFDIVQTDKYALKLIGGGTFVYAHVSGIWEEGDGVLHNRNVRYVVPGNYRFLDIGVNGQLDFDYFIGKSMVLGARIGLHITDLAGVFYFDSGISIGARF